MNVWMNDKKMDAIDWMHVRMNEGMKKIRENEFLAIMVFCTDTMWVKPRRD